MSLWWIAAGAQAAASIVQYNSKSSQNKSQLAINRYNAQMQYDTNMNNIASGLAIANTNFALTGMVANFNTQIAQMNANLIRETAKFNNALIDRSNLYNSHLIAATTEYNNSLLDAEIDDLWEAAELDQLLLANQRAVERGAIIGIQSASGTVIGEGSNADVIINSMAQEQLDALVVRHNADRQTQAVRREQAKNSYMGQLEIAKLAWEGKLQKVKNTYEANMGAFSTLANAAVQNVSMMGQAAANLAGAQISAQAQSYSARQQLAANLWNAEMGYQQNRTAIGGDLLAGMFGALGTGIQGSYMSKPVQQNVYQISYGNLLSNRYVPSLAEDYTSGQQPSSYDPHYKSPYLPPSHLMYRGISQEGSSLMGSNFYEG